jgi:hypothetical protein
MNFVGDVKLGEAFVAPDELIGDWLEELSSYTGGAQ